MESRQLQMNSDNKDLSLPRSRAKLVRKIVLVVSVGVLAVGAVAGLWYMYSPHDVLVSDSPDGAYRIVIRQPRFRFLDRNFRVVLIDQRTNVEQKIFDSWDQSPTIKKERFVWSSDSRKLALVGDRYYVVPDSELPNGQLVFLVYDFDGKKLYCNSEYDRGIPHISAQHAIEIFGDGILTENKP